MRKQLFGLVAMISTLAVGGTAVAHEVQHDSRVTLHYANDEFAGKVTSTHGKCEADRKVKIFRVEGDERTLVAKGTTDEDGFYAIALEDAPEGDYFARVTREVLRDSKKHSHVCAPDSSPTIAVNATPDPRGV